MNRKQIKAVQAAVRKVPAYDRRRVYRSYVVANCRWEMSDSERACSSELVAKLPGGTRFFHGGCVGLEVGSNILPAATTGADARGVGNAFPERTGFAYISTSLVEATVYGVQINGGGGVVYQVEPSMPLEMDTESIRTIRLMLQDKQMVAAFGQQQIIEMETAYRCPSAKITGVVFEFGDDTVEDALAKLHFEHGDDPQLVGVEGQP